MKTKKPNAELVWKQVEDLLVPRLRLSVIDRTVYSHLLRHTRLEGILRLRFSIVWLARNIRLSPGPAREAVRRLVSLGALRLIKRSKAGHVVEVRLPGEIRGMRLTRIERRAAAKKKDLRSPAAVNIEEMDFLHSKPLRKSIHARERGQCFYCLRRTTRTVHSLDHVVPRSRSGPNSYLRAGLVDELHLAQSPVLLGSGESLFTGLDLPSLGYRCVERVPSTKTTHLVLARS